MRKFITYETKQRCLNSGCGFLLQLLLYSNTYEIEDCYDDNAIKDCYEREWFATRRMLDDPRINSCYIEQPEFRLGVYSLDGNSYSGNCILSKFTEHQAISDMDADIAYQKPRIN